MNSLTFTNEGPKQIKNFDPYKTYKALTSSKQRNVRSRTDWTKGKPVTHVLTPLATKESWIRVSGVDFGNGAENLRIKAANVGDNNRIEIHKGSVSGALAGTCTLEKTANWQTYADNDCTLSGLSGVVDYVFFVFKGAKDSTMGILEWEFQGTKREPEPQTPFKGTPWSIPGKIQMEDFDVPGYGAGNDSYYDNDSENHGNSDYRKDTGVDLYAKGDKIVVGYNQVDEWLEYTVNVEESGDYTMFAAVASANNTSSFKLSMDGNDITENISVPQASSGEDNYDEYNKVKSDLTLEKGKHILRFTVTGDWMDIDYINFVKGKDAADSYPIQTEFVNKVLTLDIDNNGVYQVFDFQGHVLGKVQLNGIAPNFALSNMGINKGVYLLKQINGSKKFVVKLKK